ncbi:MAG TPA: hypothetical protein VIZ43_06785 [Trebonia sp.]
MEELYAMRQPWQRHVRIAELPGHPFFPCTLFQPELHGDGSQPHPIIRAFTVAAGQRAAALAPR